MIEETVKVVEKSGNDIVIESERKTSCSACSMNKGCGSGILANYFDRKSGKVVLRIENTINAKPGDNIVVGIDESAMVKGSFIVYIIPLIFLFVFTIAGALVAKNVESSSDIIQIAFGCSGLTFGMIWLYFYSKKKTIKSNFAPKAIRFAKGDEVCHL